ncbi:MAG: MerR family transcriptional regulator [Crocinitomicaceae bacterium]|nr:MerR family transcriptional regulator [Crocinitomicaceae bacterium]|tara:strand:+ start:3405 stop:4211 length:807 start_codon:yes stop_codon:yes gene_type:complete
MNTQTPTYNTIGIDYDSTRKADGFLASEMYQFIKTDPNGIYLDVGCGTGNYTSTLNGMGLRFIGVDPSEAMLDKARIKNSSIEWKLGTAEHIQQDNESVDGVLVSLTIHHWKNLSKGFKEIDRVLKKNGKMVLFTTLPEQTNNYWLKYYFPTMIDDSISVLPSMEKIKYALKNTELEIVEQEPYFVKPDLEDHFLYCGKHDPTLYFREEIRNGISSFSLLANQKEVESGLAILKADVESRKVKEVMRRYENDLGDYLFITCQKNEYER